MPKATRRSPQRSSCDLSSGADLFVAVDGLLLLADSRSYSQARADDLVVGAVAVADPRRCPAAARRAAQRQARPRSPGGEDLICWKGRDRSQFSQ